MKLKVNSIEKNGNSNNAKTEQIELFSKRNIKGITLIALIITIIILLILAVVSINLVINSGIIKRVKSSTSEYKKAEEQEKITLAYQEYQMAKIQGEGTPSLTVEGASVTKTKDKWIITFEDTQNTYTLKEDGTIEKQEIAKLTDVYVTLYKDGTLVFSNNEEKIEGKEVEKEYGKIEESSFEYSNPWSNEVSKILTVDFVNKIVPTSTRYWFFECENLTKINNIGNLNTSNVKDMSQMFAYCKKLNEIDLSNFNTAMVENMSFMFNACEELTNLDISNFVTSNVIDMACMFQNCKKIKELNLSNFNTDKVKNMEGMFNDCISFTELNLSNFNTSNVDSMNQMFERCSSLTQLDLSNFDTSNVIYMNFMFEQCTNLTELKLNNFNTSNVNSMNHMFEGCTNLTQLDLSSFNTSNVTEMARMFFDCGKLKIIFGSKDMWITDEVTYNDDMFSGCGTDHITFKTYLEGNKLVGYEIEAGKYWTDRSGIMQRENSGWRTSTTGIVTLDPEKTYKIKMSPESQYYYSVTEIDLGFNRLENIVYIPGTNETTITRKKYVVINIHYRSNRLKTNYK